MKEPVDHILRPSLPWRNASAEAITECGHDSSDVRTITQADFVQREKDLGKQRAAMLTCMTCIDGVRRWGGSADDLRRLLGREIEWECGGAYWRTRTDRGQLLADELTAIASLIEAHREEFDATITANQQRRDWLEKKAALVQKRPKQPGL